MCPPDDKKSPPEKNPRQAHLNAVLELSYRHLFGPTATPAEPPQKHKVVSIAHIQKLVSEYLEESDVQLIKKAFQFSDAAHLGQYRYSGEPYITHPVAVAEICAHWKLDAEAIMAALLHDVMEDQGISKTELAERFGHKVAELVDGLSKLDKIEFRSREEAQAENFRKMLLAMAHDVRVILIKLADRLHNMRTLSFLNGEKRRRIAKETLDIYVPIAHRLGLNNTYRELQELSFSSHYPHRYAVLNKAIKAMRGNRREVISGILEQAQQVLNQENVTAEISGREKTIYSIYHKMREQHLSFSEVLDIYGLRVVTETTAQCYLALGALHSLYKPMPGKFKDYIAIPKINGYQSLHTTLMGPFGTPLEFQIRTRKMHEIAEAGVAAHWLYKNGSANLNDVQQYAHQWLQSLLDIQSETGDSNEFLEHVKIDLFPDAVYVFTPASRILSLPRGATALDFAYAVHSDLGNHCAAIKINHEPSPMRAELKNGDIVEVLTAPYARPNALWLNFVRTGKARSAIRHYLKTMQLAESVTLGQYLLEKALKPYQISIKDIHETLWQKLILWTGEKNREEIFEDIGLGRTAAVVMARRLIVLIRNKDTSYEGNDAGSLPNITDVTADPVLITGAEGMSIQLAPCCRPILGDSITGYLGVGLGMVIHTTDCTVAKRIHRKDPTRWIDVAWATEANHVFEAAVKIIIKHNRGVFIRVAADITTCDANIVHISTDDVVPNETAVLRLIIQIKDRMHLATVMRRIRKNPDVIRIMRDRSLNA